MRNRTIGVVAASAVALLTPLVFASQASAQCAECAQYPMRDPFTQGLALTPSAATPNSVASPRTTRSARAELRVHHRRYAASADRRNH
jgi:hypothetical protein